MFLSDRAFVDKVQSVAVTQPPAAHRLPVHGQTTHNVLLYLIRLFNYKPLANCRSSGSWLHVFPVKAPSKALSRGFPRTAACGAWDTEALLPPLSRSHGRCCVDAACGDGERERERERAWSVGQRFHALTFFPPPLVTFTRLMRLFFSPIEFLSIKSRTVHSVVEVDSILTMQHLSSTHQMRPNIRLGCVSAGTWLCC